MRIEFILSAVLVTLTLSRVSAFDDPCTQENWDLGLTHFAYPPDNTKFIQCTAVKKYLVMPCGPATVWSSIFSTCVTTASDSTNTPAPPTPAPTTAAPPTTAAFWTPVCDGREYIEDPCDNTVYFQCSNGKAVRHSCGNLWWNIQINNCDWPQDSGRSNPGPDCLTATQAPTTPVPLPPTLTPYCPPNSNSPPMPDPCVYRAFFQCANGIAYRHACSAGLEFDNDLLVCNYDWAAKHAPKPDNCPS